jgi:hypothetical protein
VPAKRTDASSASRLARLALASAVEHGVLFRTGVPVSFAFVRNTAPSPKPRRGAVDRFQQTIEPHGMYLLHRMSGLDPGRGWMTGLVSLHSPLVLRLTTGDSIYGPDGWKARLVDAYGKKGAALSRALLASGHDGVVTVDGAHSTSEIVVLDPARSVVLE